MLCSTEKLRGFHPNLWCNGDYALAQDTTRLVDDDVLGHVTRFAASVATPTTGAEP